VDDVTFDKKGKPDLVKVDVGGFLGVGDKDVRHESERFQIRSGSQGSDHQHDQGPDQ